MQDTTLATSPRRCRAIRRDGTPCGNPPLRGAVVSRMRGGGAPQIRDKARARLWRPRTRSPPAWSNCSTATRRQALRAAVALA
jgi:hypothetical protein